MSDLSVHLRLLLRVSIFWVSICLLVWAFVSSYQTIAAGLILGSLTSLVTTLYLFNRIQKLVYILESQQKKRFSFGFLSRIAVALIAVMIAIRFEQFHLPATIIGLFYGPLASFVIAFFLSIKNYNVTGTETDTRKEGE